MKRKDHCRAGHGVVQVLIGSFQSSSSIKECDDQKAVEVKIDMYFTIIPRVENHGEQNGDQAS